MPLFPAPARTEISDAYPLPSNATARTGFGKLWDFVTSLLGTTGAKTDMLAASKILDPQAIYNLSLIPSVAGNALTMKVTSGDGATAFSTFNAGTVAQRSVTAASGTYNLRNITADIVTTISSGSTAGHLNGLAAYLYWYLLDNAGAQELAWSTKDFGLSGIVSTTAEGGAGAATSATTMYSTVARSNVPFRFIGRSTDTQSTAGLWAALPTAIEMPPQIIKPAIINVTSLLQNLSFTATVAGNILTFALKDAVGADPTPGSPVRIGFRSATLTTSTPNIREVTAALSLAISAGSTLGFSASEIRRVYLGAIDNGGVVELVAWCSLLGTVVVPTGLFAVNESGVVSTTAEGGAGAADFAGILYSITARSGVPMRILGYIEIQTGATPGNWSNAPTVLQVMGPGVRRTGDIVQVQFNTTGAVATGSTIIPYDDTIPQITEGDQYMTQAITPTSALNLIEVETQAQLTNSSSTGFEMTCALFQDAIANALVALDKTESAAAFLVTMYLLYLAQAQTTSAITYRVRAGAGIAGTTTFNGAAGARKYGGVINSFMKVKEIFA
jgi:hypothetical protein